MTSLPVPDTCGDDNRGEGDSEEEVSEEEDELKDNEEDNNKGKRRGSGTATKPKGKRTGAASRPGGPYSVSVEEAALPRTAQYKLFEDGDLIEWLCHSLAPVDWIDQVLIPGQSKGRLQPVFHLVSITPGIDSYGY